MLSRENTTSYTRDNTQRKRKEKRTGGKGKAVEYPAMRRTLDNQLLSLINLHWRGPPVHRPAFAAQSLGRGKATECHATAHRKGQQKNSAAVPLILAYLPRKLQGVMFIGAHNSAAWVPLELSGDH